MEIRVGDMCPTVDDTVLVAALIRALVATAVRDIAAGVPVPRIPGLVLRAAHWNAAHLGLTGTLLGVEGTGAVRQRRILDRTGDVRAVLAELARLTVSG